MNTIEIDTELVRQTAADLRITLTTLERERDDIAGRIGEVTERIAEWERRLGCGDEAASKGRTPRQKKGQNQREILDLLQSPPDNRRMTLTAIAKATGIPWSSTRTVLHRYASLFVEDDNGLWYAAEP